MTMGATGQLDHISRRYDREYSYPAIERARIETAVALIGAGRRVLDVGAFDGQISDAISKAGNTVVALDGSASALEVAKSRGLDTVCADLSQRWPFADGSFETVFAGEIIEHIIDGDHFLSECHRVLCGNGTLVLTTPNLASLGRRFLLLFGKNPYVDTALRPDQAGHIRYFVEPSLRRLLAENAFRADVVVGEAVAFNAKGAHSRFLARLFPGLAKSLIVRATRV